ncbi:PAS domain S-box protein [Dankookia rubra]|uniref:protein-glutamate O-methyltransferase n=1 Tax=Dankookia rubra TaxID=1442381 RepID=A0A4R5Q906_9PROT|nr:CheR family methyltransferase [Dankookia rubra]TDH58968.1 PAS domain S-box protein [Dankookia rubra]
MTGTEGPDPDFETLLRFVQEHRGVDFRGYKRASLHRRITKRMEAVGAEGFAAYHALLEANPEEFAAMLDTVLINVSSFFRDREAWEVLRREVVPRIVARHREGGRGIRIWSAGCATGQEPYSLAMLFAEAMGGAEAFCRAVKIYATDLDEAALQSARHAIYTDTEVEGVAPELLERYFERNNDRYTLQRDLRRCVIFGRHNIIHDAPISHVDLILCRNLMIYLEAATQEAVLPRLHYALREGGYLCLGKAETQLARSRLFEPVDVKHRVFRKVTEGRHRTPGGSLAFTRGSDAEQALSPQARLQEAIVDGTAVAYLAVGLDGHLTFANPAAKRLLGLGEADLGRLFQDLPISYRPVELRGRIEEAQRLGRAVRLEHQEFLRLPADPVRFTIEVTPLFGPDGQPFATLLAFTDTTRAHQLGQELQAVQEGLETHVEELQSSNEELETTNEELQSTREELETTNEELQSTNEELETSNEELRSANDELEAANDELRRQSEVAIEFRHHAEAVLRSMDLGVVVLDRDLRVRSWNRWCENAWGLRAEEAVGEEFLLLDIGFPVQRLRADLHRILAAETPQTAPELEAVDRRGRRVRVRARILPLLREARAPEGVVLVMEDVTEAARNEDHLRHLGRVIGQSLNEVYFLDPETLCFTLVNRGAEEKLGYPLAELRRMPITDLMPGVRPEAVRALVAPLLTGERREVVFETVLRAATGREYPAEICLQHIVDEQPPILLAIVHDTSERRCLTAVG